MRYASVCSGIEAPTVAWKPLGWEPVWFSEIEKFPSAVLAHHYPQVPNLGDCTRVEKTEPAELLVAGTPCQSFSRAGKRRGLRDPRGELILTAIRMARSVLGAAWLLLENVPGLLTSRDGRDWGIVCDTAAALGYELESRVLDARSFGLPQKRERLFIVGHSRKECARAVLYPGGAEEPSGGPHTEPHPIYYSHDYSQDRIYDTSASAPACVASDRATRTFFVTEQGIRALTPRERERLQGLPDDYTLIRGASDTARYRAIGNSMAVPVVRWIGERIQKAKEAPCNPT